MKWFNEHLNWTYGIIVILAVLILIPNFVTTDIEDKGAIIFTGPVIAFLLNIGAGIWILRKKGQSLWFLAIAIIFYLAFVVLALVLTNNHNMPAEKNKVSDAEYYKERDKEGAGR
jgi:peptidoglycan/LPS O-acetylase OafA/YrhL